MSSTYSQDIPDINSLIQQQNVSSNGFGQQLPSLLNQFDIIYRQPNLNKFKTSEDAFKRKNYYMKQKTIQRVGKTIKKLTQEIKEQFGPSKQNFSTWNPKLGNIEYIKTNYYGLNKKGADRWTKKIYEKINK